MRKPDKPNFWPAFWPAFWPGFWRGRLPPQGALSLVGVGLLASLMSGGAARAEKPAIHPVVVELFQSQGCSSCPPANLNLLGLVDRPDVLALSFGVTYWDQLGWKDTFASAKNTQRQCDYARGLHHDNVGTPQMVINGRTDIVGIDSREVERTIKAARLPDSAPNLTLSGGALTIGDAQAPKTGADVWLVRYDPRIVQVAIKRGENGGRTLPHRNVVRELVRLWAWSGAHESFALPAAGDPAWQSAILVQAVSGGPILAALKP